jgi:hypothetical protein
MSESSTSIQEDYARDEQTKKVLKVKLFYSVQLQRMRHVNAVDGVIGILGQLIHVGEYGRVIEDALRDAEDHAFDLQHCGPWKRGKSLAGGASLTNLQLSPEW